MKIGFSTCNYPYRPLPDSLLFAKEHGFDFVEVMGSDLDRQIAADGGARLAASLRKHGLEMTVHHALPDPDDEEKVAVFRDSVRSIRAFQERERVVSVLSLDTWVNREKSLDNILLVLELFKDSGVPVLTEDFPLNGRQAEMWREALRYPNYGLLSDLGHTNVRLTGRDENMWCLNEDEGAPLPRGDNSPEAFRNALTKKPLPVMQIHVHNNHGVVDDHRDLTDGTADFAAIARVLKDIGFDGYVDLEVSPTIHGHNAVQSDQMLLNDLRLWKDFWGRA